MDSGLASFCRSLPKAELHAHLSGSIRPSTLSALLSARGNPCADAPALLSAGLPGGPTARSLSDCFRVFSLIHAAVRSEADVRRVTREAVHDAAADGVLYLELRTTPRALEEVRGGAESGASPAAAPACGPAAASPDGRVAASLTAALGAYVQCVVEELAAVEAACGGVGEDMPIVRLLLSVDRTRDVAVAEATVALALRYAREGVAAARGGAGGACGECVARRAAAAARERGAQVEAQPLASGAPPPLYGPYVCGVDLSGDPTRGDARAFLPALAAAAEGGLRLSLHAGEVAGAQAEAETEALLAWGAVCVGEEVDGGAVDASDGVATGSEAGGAVGARGAGAASAAAIPASRLAPACGLTALPRRRVARWGHMALLSARAAAALEASGAAVEVCPTSSVTTLRLEEAGGLLAHPHLARWLQRGTPLALCTDDTAVFNISLSSEYARLAREMGRSREDMARCAAQAFQHAFLEEGELRQRLLRRVEQRVEEVLRG